MNKPSPTAATSNLSSNALGAIFMMLSMVGFVFNDTLMKLVANDLSLFQAILIRGIFACFFMILLCAYMGVFKVEGGIMHVLRHRTIMLRTIGEAGGTYFFLSALFEMPIANVTVVLQILPLTITLAAALFLGEAVGWRRCGAIIAGFLSVLLIVEPGMEGFNFFAIYAVISTGFITLRDLVTPKCPQTSTPCSSVLSPPLSLPPWAPLTACLSLGIPSAEAKSRS